MKVGRLPVGLNGQLENLRLLITVASLIMPYLKRHWKPHMGLLALIFVDIGLTLTMAWFMGTITDAAVSQSFERLKGLIPTGVLLTLFTIAAGYLRNHLEFRSATTIKKELQESLYKKLLLLPARYTNGKRAGELLTHFSQDLDGVNGLIGTSLIQMIRLPLVFVAVLLYMVQIHWMLALVSLVAAPLAAVVGSVFALVLRRNSREIYDLGAIVNSCLNETIHGLAVIRSFTLENRFFGHFMGYSERMYVLEHRDARYQGIYNAMGQAAGSGIFLLSLCLGAYYVSTGRITVGALLSFVNLTGHLIYPLTGMAGIWVGFQKSLPAMERLYGVMNEEAESRELPEYQPMPPVGQSIAFRDVSFNYSGQRELFDGFRLEVAAGEMVAVVGVSGAGKSTLFHLLQGTYKPHAGSILLGGVPIDRMTPAELRSSIALVPQETFLFAGSIRDNLLLARPDVTEAEMMEAARCANIHDFIMTLPEGYETQVGERGVALSGGQRQRVAIARAILKDAPILLFDEATSSLDGESEQKIKEALDGIRHKGNRTILLIAHRLSTVYKADRIIVLEEGKLVQSGRHEELMAQDGPYRRLVQRQFVEEPASIL